MMFRTRHGKHRQTVLCIRTTYDPKMKRGVQEVVGRFPLYAGKFPAAGEAFEDFKIEDLTADERAQAAAFHAQYHARIDNAALRSKGHIFVRTADEISAALDDDDAAQLVLQGLNAAEVYRAIDRLQRALRRHKLTRPASARRSEGGDSGPSDPNQMSLLEG